MANFTNADEKKLLSQPGFLYYRSYESSDPWNKAVFLNGATYTPTVESAEIAFDDVGNVRDEVSTETVELTFDSGRVLDFDMINDLTGGLYTKSVVDGTPVSGAEQVVSSGSWSFDNVFVIENQNADLSEITINSVTGSVDGALVEDTDYFKVKLPEVGWGIYIVDSATVTVEAQDMTVDYDYTPASKTILKRGGTKIITPIELAYQTVDEDGNYAQFFFYKCFTNGADGHGFSPEQTAEPVVMSLTFTAKKDTNRETGDELMRKEIGPGVTSLG